MRFQLATDHVSIGMSFRQTAAAIQHAKDHTKMGKLSGVNDQVLDQYTRVQVAVTLEQITHILGDESVGRCSLLEMAARTVGSHFSTSACVFAFVDLSSICT
ncbi:hypothetical protein F442_10323 [Phytophthora nicotianae P10297]|uniref:Uncharacterized protein n=1 Tax=Phytophthora nicotianae P10297 TaxID=1317064 RepID=W2Z6W2_PHYNI|nr:hypothetical protein F442_10323 [Phytophthora nicotianae P10297]